MIVAMACVASASAQDATQALYQGRITSNNVNVRTGPVIGDSYPFGKLQSGDVVEVIEESNGWVRVRTSGGAFAGMHAFVSGGTLSADGTTLSLTAESPLRAPNSSAQGAARNSYQSIATLPAGTTLNVVETLEVDGLPVYKVRMPATAASTSSMSSLSTGYGLSGMRSDGVTSIASNSLPEEEDEEERDEKGEIILK